VIAVEGVTYRVAGRDLLADVSADFAPGLLHLIIGANGAGKSTLVKVASRLLRPHRGRVSYGGVDVASATEVSLARHRAVLSQAIELAFPLAVRDVVMMGRYPHFHTHPGPDDHAIVDDAMRYFDVGDLATRDYPTLSGGEKQRVNFARVLAQVWRPSPAGTRVLFLDEPLTFLDVGHQLDFMKKIRTFAAQDDVIVIGVVHDLNLAARFADRLLLLHHGAVLAAGARADVLTAAHVRTAFGVGFVTAVAPGIDGTHLIFD